MQPTSKVFIIVAGDGEYSDRSEWPLVAFTDEAAADALLARLSSIESEAKKRDRAMRGPLFGQETEEQRRARRDLKTWARQQYAAAAPALDWDRVEVLDVDFAIAEAPLFDSGETT